MNDVKFDKKTIEEIDAVSKQSVFSEDMYKLFKDNGLTDEEIDTLENAELLANAVEDLPDDPAEVIAELKKVPTDEKEAAKYILNLAKNDPKTLANILAATQVADLDMGE